MGIVTKSILLLGLAMATGALILLGEASAMGGGSTDFVMLGASILAFLFGIFLFGWALGKRTQY